MEYQGTLPSAVQSCSRGGSRAETSSVSELSGAEEVWIKLHHPRGQGQVFRGRSCHSSTADGSKNEMRHRFAAESVQG